MTVTIDRVAPAYQGHHATSPASRWGGVALFVTTSSLYFAVGSVLMLRYNIFEGDGISRVANAGFVLMSRDPHLSAVGFVWNPLPSFVEVPLLLFSRWWPALKDHGLAGVIQSALVMAGAAVLIRRIALDRGTGSVWRWTAVACFALNPVIVIYGGSGMSEAAEIFSILWCIRHLLRWLDTRAVGDLAWAGIALGVGYLARYEMVPVACGAVVVVAIAAFHHSPGPNRRDFAVLCAAIVGFPIAAAVISWAVSGWILTGHLLSTVSSQYGNTSQVAVARAGSAQTHADWWVIAERLFAMQPFVGIAVILAVALSIVNKTLAPLVPLVTFGAVLLFSLWGEYSGTTFGFFRYYVTAIPMVIIIALVCWNPTTQPLPWRRPGSVPTMGAGMLCASLLIAIPVTTQSMLNGEIGNHQVQFGLSSLVDPQGHASESQWYRRVGDDDRLIADYLDSQHLPDGSVAMDTFMGWAVWLASADPRQFVITSDYDFVAALNRPWDFGIKYILITNPVGGAAPDAINKRYPTMWADGAGLGTLVHAAKGPFGEERWRIYRIDQPLEPTS